MAPQQNSVEVFGVKRKIQKKGKKAVVCQKLKLSGRFDLDT